ncbi:MAG: hypothetical protein V4812_19260 [Pseudomonadota bacterium]
MPISTSLPVRGPTRLGHSGTTLAALLALPALASGAEAPLAAPAGTPVISIVQVPKPWYAPRFLVVGKMRDSIPEYRAASGLAFKAYAFERASGAYGGLYYWRDASDAKAWFNEAWFARVRQERGVEGRVRIFAAPVSLDNVPGGTRADNDSDAVATLVEMAIPEGVDAQRLVAQFEAAVPAYRKVPGLLRKHFLLTEPGSFGGLYLWQDEASARAWFNADWHRDVVERHGRAARIEWFDTPLLLPIAQASQVVAQQALVP